MPECNEIQQLEESSQRRRSFAVRSLDESQCTREIFARHNELFLGRTDTEGVRSYFVVGDVVVRKVKGNFEVGLI